MKNGPNESNDLLSAYHDGELSAAERQTVDRLLQDSVDARAELEDYQTISASLRSLPRERAPAGFQSAVLNQIRGGSNSHNSLRKESTSPKRRVRRVFLATLIGGLVTAACVFIAVQGQFTTNRIDSGENIARTEAAGGRPEALSEADAASSPSSLGSDAEEPQGMEDSPSGELGEGTSAGISEIAAGDISAGDSYSYFDQTEDGEVVVVEATVVDVRQAIDQLQVLFVKNNIKTATVGFGESEELEERSNSATPHSDWAIYVESDPLLIDNALEQLREQVRTDGLLPEEETSREQIVQKGNAFVDLKLAGTIDSPVEALDFKGKTQVGQLRNALNPPLDVEAARSGPTRNFADNAGRSYGNDRPQARYSVAAETMSRGAASEPLPPLLKPDIALENEVEQRSLSYQTIVNVSKSQLDKQLQAPKLATANLRREKVEEFSQDRLSVDEAAVPGASPSTTKAAPDNFQLKQAQRRGRMLVVLQSRAEGKNSRSLQPVEAPLPQAQ